MTLLSSNVVATAFIEQMAVVCPVGIVLPYAGHAAPDGWFLCDGQAVSRTTYAKLFTVIGEHFGVGDGSTTFNVPELSGRSVAGVDDMGTSTTTRKFLNNTLYASESYSVAAPTAMAGTQGGDMAMNFIIKHSNSLPSLSGTDSYPAAPAV